MKVTGIHTGWHAYTQMGSHEVDEVWIKFTDWIHIYILILMLYCRFSRCYWGRAEYIGFPCVISHSRMWIYTITRESLYTVVFQSQRASVWILTLPWILTSCLCNLLLNLPQPQMVRGTRRERWCLSQGVLFWFVYFLFVYIKQDHFLSCYNNRTFDLNIEYYFMIGYQVTKMIKSIIWLKV